VLLLLLRHCQLLLNHTGQYTLRHNKNAPNLASCIASRSTDTFWYFFGSQHLFALK